MYHEFQVKRGGKGGAGFHCVQCMWAVCERLASSHVCLFGARVVLEAAAGHISAVLKWE